MHLVGQAVVPQARAQRRGARAHAKHGPRAAARLGPEVERGRVLLRLRRLPDQKQTLLKPFHISKG